MCKGLLLFSNFLIQMSSKFSLCSIKMSNPISELKKLPIFAKKIALIETPTNSSINVNKYSSLVPAV